MILVDLFLFPFRAVASLTKHYIIFPYLSKSRTVNLAGHEVDFEYKDFKGRFLVVGTDYAKGISFFDMEENKPRACMVPGNCNIKEWDKRYKMAIEAIKTGKFELSSLYGIADANISRVVKVNCPYEEK